MLTKQDKKAIKSMRKRLRQWQCENCRAGKPCKHTFSNIKKFLGKQSVSYIEDGKTGKRKYFCNFGCTLQSLSDDEVRQTFERMVC
jgi:hypothetical protein